MNIYDKIIAIGGSIAIAIGVSVVIVDSEGLVQKPYLDPKKILTVCYGHTGGILDKNKKYTQDECLELLLLDAESAEAVLKRAVKPAIYNKMKDYEKAAFISFIFNVGHGKKGVKDGFVELKNGNTSTMLRLINENKITLACEQFMSWTQENQGMPGLKIRRQKEKNLCLGKFILK